MERSTHAKTLLSVGCSLLLLSGAAGCYSQRMDQSGFLQPIAPSIGTPYGPRTRCDQVWVTNPPCFGYHPTCWRPWPAYCADWPTHAGQAWPADAEGNWPPDAEKHRPKKAEQIDLGDVVPVPVSQRDGANHPNGSSEPVPGTFATATAWRGFPPLGRTASFSPPTRRRPQKAPELLNLLPSDEDNATPTSRSRSGRVSHEVWSEGTGTPSSPE